MDRLEDARSRAILISKIIQGRQDVAIRLIIESYPGKLDYSNSLEDLAIAPDAWRHVTGNGIDPKLVFAHPALLRAHPNTSLHYRGISTLSLKRVQQIAGSVDRWGKLQGVEETQRPRISDVRIKKVVRLYNAVILTIIGGSTSWSLENGYRNILATIGITEDGKLRNIIGREAEQGLKDKISDWLNNESSINCQGSGASSSSWLLGRNREVRMSYSSEPDILFEKAQESGRQRTWETVSVIEVKGGTDPAGALERLGAMKKTFDRTPVRSKNFLVVGIVTGEMYRQMSSMHMENHFILWDVMHDNEKWDGFISEIFHHTLRLLPGPYHSAKPHSKDK